MQLKLIFIVHLKFAYHFYAFTTVCCCHFVVFIYLDNFPSAKLQFVTYKVTKLNLNKYLLCFQVHRKFNMENFHASSKLSVYECASASL